MPSANVFTHWYLDLPSWVLAALIYLLIARLILPPALRRAATLNRLFDHLLGRPPSSSPADNLVIRFLAVLTDPVVRLAGTITPRIVPLPLVIVFAILWLLSARILLNQAVMARRMLG